MLNDVMLNVAMLNVAILNVVMLSVVVTIFHLLLLTKTCQTKRKENNLKIKGKSRAFVHSRFRFFFLFPLDETFRSKGGSVIQ